MPKFLTRNEVFDHIADIALGSSLAILDITRFESMFFLNSLLSNLPSREKIIVCSCEPLETPFHLNRISLDRLHDLTELSLEVERCRQAAGDEGVVIHHYLPHLLVKESEELVLRMVEYWLAKQPDVQTTQFFTLPTATFPAFEKKLQALVSGVISIHVVRTDKESLLSFQITGTCRPEYHMKEFPFLVQDGRLKIKWRGSFTDVLPREEETFIKDRIEFLRANLYSTRIVRGEAQPKSEDLSLHDLWLLSQLVGWRLDQVTCYFPEESDEVLRKLALWNLRDFVRFEPTEPHPPAPLKKQLKSRTHFALFLPTPVSLQLLRKRQHTIPMAVYNALRRSVHAFILDRMQKVELGRELSEFETYFQDMTARAAAVETFRLLGEDIRREFDMKYLPKILALAIYYGYGVRPKISRLSEGLFHIEVRDCFICSGAQSEAPVCQLLIGTIVGCCSVVFKKRFTCSEVRCKAAGDASCVFHLKEI
ncbi:MAG: 4-vinyl reductase [Candidatus Bathyarchaeia archaeon]